MKMVVALALALVVTWACGCKHSELDSFHSKWKKLPLSPLAGAILFRQAEVSPCTWNVQANGDGITIQRISTRSHPQHDKLRVQFAGGTLVGEDRGEWGGSLSVLAGNNQSPKEILSKNVLQMFPMHGGVVVITGSLAANEGSIWYYSNAEGHGWSIKKRLDLHGYPTVIGKSGDRILLAYGDAVAIVENFNDLALRMRSS